MQEQTQTQKKIDPIERWLGLVAYSKSGSKNTERAYRRNFREFLSFIGKSAEDIINDYWSLDPRRFKAEYKRLVQNWILALQKKGLASHTIKVAVASIQSFFKYTDLPLGRIPQPRTRITYHNRDITKEEIAHILRVSRPRDRAFYAVMTQSGLRPSTICKLKLKHLEPDRFEKNETPIKIEVPQNLAKGKYRHHFTFLSEESVAYLKDYFKKRPDMTRGSYLFTKIGRKDPISPKSLSHSFRSTLDTLKEKGVIDFEQREKGKPAELRLYSLRKYFRKHAHQAGFELVQFWMGHIVKAGVDEHYRPTDSEFHRKLYSEKAAPFLRIEAATPTETEQVIKEQAEEIEALKQHLNKQTEILETLARLWTTEHPSVAGELNKLMDKLAKPLHTDAPRYKKKNLEKLTHKS